MIPRLVHFCYFGLTEPAREFPLCYYLAIRSAAHWLKPDAILFHNTREPHGPFWERARPWLTRVPCEPPAEIHGRPLRHFAHQADVVRLQVLQKHGGIYLDIDTLCRRSFDPLLGHSCVLGVQRYTWGDLGLCNAVLASEPEAPFIREWLDSYRTFRSTGRDEFWDEHSVRMPSQLARLTRAGTSDRADVHIEPETSFFTPDYAPISLRQLFEEVAEFPLSYCHHLWETYSFARYLAPLTERLIREVDTTYNVASRALL